ncbi:MAG: ribosome biogenesis GTP-binding protein YihA/YsxC [Oscillospiraceae bacterium]|nr:ribosome biogenesis GTP-binding protein YihA/YsxC [Oscillospiraceae bacterium]
MNWHNAAHHSSYGKYSQLPPKSETPEIAFSGRSNVGKSSLINKLLNRKSLARVSGKPGKTITINFFDIDGKVFIADLPGYGYAKIAKSEKERFGTLTESYLRSGRVALLIQLIDFRHPPTKDDLTMLDFLRESGIEFAVALTKADKLKKKERERNYAAVKSLLPDTEVIEFSAQTGEGVEELRRIIESQGRAEVSVALPPSSPLDRI